jgi:predicted oxidoreductase
VVNQVEIHLGRIECLEDGTLAQCLERRITPLSWSPLAGGWLGEGRKLGLNDPQYAHRRNIQNVADEVARELGVSRTVVALAWLMKHPSGIIPIVGSNNPEHIRDAARADTVEMSREQWYRLVVAARGSALP